MKIIRADTLGFCPGVRMAVKAAEEAATGNPGSPVFILGQIVHNPRVSARLAELGARELPSDDGTGAPAGSVVVIRSHGTTPATIAKLEAAGARIVDATCPKVAANQRAAADYASRGFTVVIAGDHGHGETLGVAGHAPGSIIVSTVAEAQAQKLPDKAVLLAQTTMSEGEYRAILEALRRLNPSIMDCGGICGATQLRQDALKELCSRVDAVVVVGGKNSANTRRLAERVEALGKPAFLVEEAEDLQAELWGYATVGLTAGASTPDEVIDEVEARLMKSAF